MPKSFKQTPSQTVGPFFAYGLTPRQYGYNFGEIASSQLTKSDTKGERISIIGKLYDGTGTPMANAVIEIWQADSEGNYAPLYTKDKFFGYGRVGTGTDPENRFVIETIKPGRVDDQQAPHIALIIMSRGIMQHVYTRLYFSDEAEANAKDPVLNALPAERKTTLIAERKQNEDRTEYHFDIYMQGENETVFLEF
ncbi:MAG: protocatechuate 3,4-dioxygenase subunit alpha [Verrucomicrobia bacterium]|nr:protocatechuate 3,4-dioxygenase subunit alpha [Verrucomicrobiota bacterium]